MRTLQSVGLVLQYISIETLSWVTQLKIEDICLCIYMCVDVRVLFCTLTLTFLCLLRGLPLPIPPLN